MSQAPWFHENHILSGNLAFNLLMGRRWPASDADLADARALCEELGLGDLLRTHAARARPTGGRDRLAAFMAKEPHLLGARAAAECPLTILDESFAALDPETISRCLDCVPTVETA